MKKRLLLFTLCFIFSNQIFSQTVPEEQRTLVTKISATWCPPCGGWGWTFFENLIEDNEEKAVLIAAHHSGQLANPTSEAIADNFNIFSQPLFYLNNSNQNVSPSNSESKRTAIKDVVEANFETSPIANAGADVFVTDMYEITVKAKFFQETEGEYLLGVYLVENDLVHFQESIGNDAVHHKVLRNSITNNFFGDSLATGIIEAGTEMDFQYSIEPDWSAHVEVMMIIWKKVDDTYFVENVNMVEQNDFVIVNATDDLLSEAKMKIQPNMISSEATLLIDLEKNLNNASIAIFDLMGKKVADIYAGNLVEGDHILSLQKPNSISSGMYFVTLQAEGKVISEKIIFE